MNPNNLNNKNKENDSGNIEDGKDTKYVLEEIEMGSIYKDKINNELLIKKEFEKLNYLEKEDADDLEQSCKMFYLKDVDLKIENEEENEESEIEPNKKTEEKNIINTEKDYFYSNDDNIKKINEIENGNIDEIKIITYPEENRKRKDFFKNDLYPSYAYENSNKSLNENVENNLLESINIERVDQIADTEMVLENDKSETGLNFNKNYSDNIAEYNGSFKINNENDENYEAAENELENNIMVNNYVENESDNKEIDEENENKKKNKKIYNLFNSIMSDEIKNDGSNDMNELNKIENKNSDKIHSKYLTSVNKDREMNTINDDVSYLEEGLKENKIIINDMHDENYSTFQSTKQKFENGGKKLIKSFEKLKNSLSSDYMLNKTNKLKKKKAKICKIINNVCVRYNMTFSLLLYFMCAMFILIPLIEDCWKTHLLELSSAEEEKSVIINIGLKGIRRIQKITKNSGQVYMSYDRNHYFDYLIDHEACLEVTKNDVESFLVELSKGNKLISDPNNNINETEIQNETYAEFLKKPEDIGILNDMKFILARKYLIGPTIYNIECKYLNTIKSFTTYYNIILITCIFLLFLIISIILFIFMKYKKNINILLCKKIILLIGILTFLIILISTYYLNKSFDIPLCVNKDGTPNICKDGFSTYFIFLELLLLFATNFYFYKFLSYPIKPSVIL